MAFDSGFLLEVKDLKKSFPGVLALKGVSLTLGRGYLVNRGKWSRKKYPYENSCRCTTSGFRRLFYRWKKVDFKNVRDARNCVISLIGKMEVISLGIGILEKKKEMAELGKSE